MRGLIGLRAAVIGLSLAASHSAFSDARAQSVPNKTAFSGRNVYSPSLAYDEKSHKFQMWYGGWQNPSDYPFDKIYYRTSSDGKIWSSPVTALTPRQIPGRIEHVNDPSVIKVINRVTKKLQYTMFYTVCVVPCKTNKDNQIWSSVSEDGINWLFPRPLLRTKGAAVPSVVSDDRGNWTMFYSNTDESPNKVYAIDVSGDRETVGRERIVYTYPYEGFVANPEVALIAGKWTLLFNVYHTRRGAKRRTGDIYVVQSMRRSSWQSGAERPLILNDPEGDVCATLSPAVLPIDSTHVVVQFAQARYSPDGDCDFATFGSVQQSVLSNEKLDGSKNVRLLR